LKASVKIFRVQDRQFVDADLLPISDKHLADFETFWKPRLQASNEQDSHWEWKKKVSVLRAPSCELYALECDRIAQGMMILEIDRHRSRLENGRSLVYVDFLAVAPWNRPSPEGPMYKAVGTALITFAIQRSIDLEYKGRLGLHALSKAHGFYKKLQLVDFGPDPSKQNLNYFELSVKSATDIISKSDFSR
jgi:hypothetical protein